MVSQRLAQCLTHSRRMPGLAEQGSPPLQAGVWIGLLSWLTPGPPHEDRAGTSLLRAGGHGTQLDLPPERRQSWCQEGKGVGVVARLTMG